MNDMTNYRILVAGDIMPAEGNQDLFVTGNVTELFGDRIMSLFGEVDYSIANLEGVLTDTIEVQPKAGPIIKAPKESVALLKNLGLKACALANNHVTDANQIGISDTLSTLSDAYIDYVGVGKIGEMKTHITKTFGEKSICIYNVSEIFFNLPDEDSIGANVYDEYVVCNEIRELKQKHDYLVVIFHAGSEYFRYPTPDVRRKCHRMVDSGADIITTQHTHCVGCEEYYKNAYILYGQGNFCFGRHKNKERQKITQKGILLELLFSEEGFSIKKHMTSIHDNRYVRLDDVQDFGDFEKRSDEVASGKSFEKELTECKYNEIAQTYLSAYRGANLYYRALRKFSPELYKKTILRYTKKQLLIIISTLGHDRRNEEMKLIFQYLLKNTSI